jgi:hypothetical protein
MPTGALGQEPKYRNLLLECDGLANEITTGTCATSAVTISDYSGLITTEALTTAQNAIETITVTNTKVTTSDLVFVTIGNGTNSQGTPMLGLVTTGSGSFTVKIINKHATAESLNGTLKIGFIVVKAL